ncbi:hypothetical protein WFM01_17145 [Yersinia enterocolitica]
MNVNTSASVYSYVQNTAGNLAKTASSQPAPAYVHSSTEAQSTSPSQTTISDQGLMMSRLFGNTKTIPEVQTQLTKTTMSMDSASFLTLDDRNMLSGLYTQAQEQGTDLRYVDDLAHDLGQYRMFGGVSGNYNAGNMYDETGRMQTIYFIPKDSETASRILNGDNTSSSFLDPAFLKYELDSGYSFSHVANFDYLESIVNSGKNTTLAGQSKISKFSSYESQGQNNYVLNTASEVTLKLEEPDVISKDGVFTVTETGKKHGFRLEGNGVVQDKDFSLVDPQPLTKTVTTLLDNFLSQTKTEVNNSGKPTTMFDYLFISKSDKNNK